MGRAVDFWDLTGYEIWNFVQKLSLNALSSRTINYGNQIWIWEVGAFVKLEPRSKFRFAMQKNVLQILLIFSKTRICMPCRCVKLIFLEFAWLV